jgi:hypothetical protein
MKFLLKTKSLFIIFLFLVACNVAPEKTQPEVVVSTSTSSPIPTLTARPTQTETPIPLATHTPWATKEILAQFGVFGGDGGWIDGAFIGSDVPKWVLYTDGQLIFKKKDNSGVWFEETTLAVPQMCAFLSQIEKSGFFSLEINNSSESKYPTDDPIYKFDDTVQFSVGGPDYVLQVNGSKHRQIHVYTDYAQYLIPEAKQVFDLFNNYSPPSQLTTYQAQYLVLRIEEGVQVPDYLTPVPLIQEWSANLPPLELLQKKSIEIEGSPFFSNSAVPQITNVLITGEQIKSFFEAFGNRLSYKFFQNGNQMYGIVARPFLPHENLNKFSEFPAEEEFELPFSCNN